MLVGTVSSFGWIEKGRYSEIKPADAKVHLIGCTPAFRSAQLWCQYGSRLHEFKGGEIVTHDLGGLVTAGSRQIFFDRSDNIWLATQSDGLVRLSPQKISLVGDLTGLDVWARYAIVEDATGAVWLAAHNLLKVVGKSVEKVEIQGPAGAPELITSLAVDRNNILWAGGLSGLYTVKNGRSEAWPGFKPGQIKSLFFDSHDALWIGSETGLWRLNDGEFSHFTVADGLVDNDVHFITQARDDSIWIGTVRGARKFKNGKFENITSVQGLPGNYCEEIVGEG